jgi:predicted transposase YbfD/YdcC
VSFETEVGVLGRAGLSVRLVTAGEVARFDALLDEHHFLGHRLFGRVLRYVAVDDSGEWVALVGFGSAALSLAARERYVGWDESQKLRRLRFVANNQRFCVLPAGRQRNLASAVLARTLRRLSSDMERVYGHRVLLVETFTDPARHRGVCYQAANFEMVGETSGYGRRNGSWVHHGVKKLCWLYPLHRDAAGILSACFDHPILASPDVRSSRMLDLNTIVIDGERGLFERLSGIADHRKRRGVRHDLASILVVCVAGMLCGCYNPTEIAEWAGALSDDMRLRLRCRRSPTKDRLVVPSLSTIQRALNAVDREALDRVVSEVLADSIRAKHARRGEQRVNAKTSETNPRNPERSDSDSDSGGGRGGGRGAGLRAVAVDGKTIRGARQSDGRALHLLSAFTHDERVVIAQREVDHKVNEITMFQPLLTDLDLHGVIVTADAMHTQRDHARFLVEDKHAHYLFTVKENQPSLYNEIGCWNHKKFSQPYVETCKGHGRLERRSIQVASTPDGLAEFPHVAQVIRIEREVRDARSGILRFKETVLALTSAPPALYDPRALLNANRQHWGIENSLHWVRDATMREDASKVRSGSAPRALATIRNLVLSVLRLAGATNIAKSLRNAARQPAHAITLLGL